MTSSWPTTPKIFLSGPLRTSLYTPDINYILFYLRSQRLRVHLRPEARDLLSSLRLWHPSISTAHPPLHTLLCLANPYLSIRLAVPSSRKPSLISRNQIRGPSLCSHCLTVPWSPHFLALGFSTATFLSRTPKKMQTLGGQDHPSCQGRETGLFWWPHILVCPRQPIYACWLT